MAGTLVANTINTDTGLFSTNNAYLGIAKAWVNFAGSTGTRNASFNVSSVTLNSTGNYTVAFTTALSDANYCPVVGSAFYGTSTAGGIGMGAASLTTANFNFLVVVGTSNYTPANNIYLAVVGN
jgi:hypothetical protein